MDRLKLKQKLEIEKCSIGVYVNGRLKGIFASYDDAKNFGNSFSSINIEIAPMPYFEVNVASLFNSIN